MKVPSLSVMSRGQKIQEEERKKRRGQNLRFQTQAQQGQLIMYYTTDEVKGAILKCDPRHLTTDLPQLDVNVPPPLHTKSQKRTSVYLML